MAEVLLAAVLLLTGLTLLNLVLVLGVVRRLREHETRLSRHSAALGPLTGGEVPVLGLRPGDRLPPLTLRPVAGGEVTVPDGRPVLLGFFSPGCGACHERLPEFRSAAAAHTGLAVAVVVADGDADTLTGALTATPGVTVVVEDPQGPLQSALAVTGYPAFAYADAGGVLRAAGFELPLPQPA